jgi:hypothetical protein
MRTGTFCIAVAALTGAAHAVSIGQIDSFDTDVANWVTGSTQVHQPNGGPAGVGDGFLEVSRTATPFHVGTRNETQWAGDYLAAGIQAIEMDLSYLGGNDPLNIRLVLFGAGGAWASTSTTPVTPGWDHYTFGITAADLVFVDDTTDSGQVGGGTGVLNDTLASLNVLLIRNDSAVPTPVGQHPPHIIATLGIDNIQAVPEPASILLTVVGGSILVGSRSRRRRCAARH